MLRINVIHMCKCLYLLNYTKIISELDSLNLLSIAYTQTHISIDLGIRYPGYAML